MDKNCLGIYLNDLEIQGAVNTACEISSQPELLLKVYETVKEKSGGIKSFLDEIFKQEKEPDIILTGAGTSAFIGEVLEGVFNKFTRFNARASATTNIVTHPGFNFKNNKTTLLISFARSGSSPESVKAIKSANEFCEKIYHLVITCNPDGELAKTMSGSNSFVLFMPPEANDKGLAMTASFTSMLLGGLLIAKLGEIETLETQVIRLSEYAERLIEESTSVLFEISKLDFKRAVFLGSGIFTGIAHESHLKLQELTDGKVICKYDSFLGFRHGPKAVIDKDTLIVYLFSNSPYVVQYEKDLVNSISEKANVLNTIGVMENEIEGLKLDHKIIFGKDSGKIDEILLPVVEVIPAQVLGFFKSLNLGLKPDTPSPSGMISRVVEGVQIYPYFE